ncbi:transposase [Facklamia hominis]
MDPDRLVHTNYLHFPLFNYRTNTGSIIDYLLGKDVMLKETYETVHRLVSAIRDRDFDRFKETIDQSKIKTLPKGLKRVIHSFNKYLEAIKNTCHHPQLGNGPIEGITRSLNVMPMVIAIIVTSATAFF